MEHKWETVTTAIQGVKLTWTICLGFFRQLAMTSVQKSTDLGRGLRPRPRFEKNYSPCVREAHTGRDIYETLQPKICATLYTIGLDSIFKCGCPKGTRIGRKNTSKLLPVLDNPIKRTEKRGIT
jgi:hypothetical protein